MVLRIEKHKLAWLQYEKETAISFFFEHGPRFESLRYIPDTRYRVLLYIVKERIRAKRVPKTNKKNEAL